MSNTPNKLTPKQLVLERPRRRSQSEMLLFKLVGSSYSHASLGNLAMGLLESSLDDDTKHDLCKNLLQLEREHEIGTFIRCIKADMRGGTFSFTVLAYDVNNLERTIDDKPDNHKEVGRLLVSLEDHQSVTVAKDFLRYLLSDAMRVMNSSGERRRTSSNSINTNDVIWLKYHKTNEQQRSKPVRATSEDIVSEIEEEVLNGRLNLYMTTQSIVLKKADVTNTFKKPHVPQK